MLSRHATHPPPCRTPKQATQQMDGQRAFWPRPCHNAPRASASSPTSWTAGSFRRAPSKAATTGPTLDASDGSEASTTTDYRDTCPPEHYDALPRPGGALGSRPWRAWRAASTRLPRNPLGAIQGSFAAFLEAQAMTTTSTWRGPNSHTAAGRPPARSSPSACTSHHHRGVRPTCPHHECADTEANTPRATPMHAADEDRAPSHLMRARRTIACAPPAASSRARAPTCRWRPVHHHDDRARRTRAFHTSVTTPVAPERRRAAPKRPPGRPSAADHPTLTPSCAHGCPMMRQTTRGIHGLRTVANGRSSPSLGAQVLRTAKRSLTLRTRNPPSPGGQRRWGEEYIAGEDGAKDTAGGRGGA